MDYFLHTECERGVNIFCGCQFLHSWQKLYMTFRIFRHVCLEVHSVSILQQYGKHVLLYGSLIQTFQIFTLGPFKHLDICYTWPTFVYGHEWKHFSYSRKCLKIEICFRFFSSQIFLKIGQTKEAIMLRFFRQV